jgi:hypothetical protein
MKDIEQLLGKTWSSVEVQAFARILAGEPDTYKDGSSAHFTFREDGIELKFDATGLLQDIFFLSEGEDSNVPYGGPLPFDLRFGMSRAEVRDLLGPPTETADSQLILGIVYPEFYRYIFNSYSVQMCYESNGCLLTTIIVHSG